MSQENINDNVKAVQDVVENIAKTEQGKKYVYGSNDSTKSFDCSSFVQYVNGKIDIILPRTAREQAKIGQTIETNFDEKKLQKGDRLYFKNDSKQPEIVTHTAIYLGNGKIIHASSRSGKVVVEKIADRSDLFKNGNFASAKRDIDSKTASKIISKTIVPILNKLNLKSTYYLSKENKINSNNKKISKEIIKKNTSVKNTSVLALKFLNPFNNINLDNINKTKSKANKNNFTQNTKITIESTNSNKNINFKNINSKNINSKNIATTKKTNFNSKKSITKTITKNEYKTQKI